MKRREEGPKAMCKDPVVRGNVAPPECAQLPGTWAVGVEREVRPGMQDSRPGLQRHLFLRG